MLTRRRFLLHLLRSSAALAGLSLINPPASADDPPEHVIVIGAGISGLAAAQALQSKGVTVTVLEARDRIGGRVWTDRAWPGIPIDLGASWIHGTEGNPLTALCDAIGLRRLPSDTDNAIAFDHTGAQISDEDLDALEAFLDDILSDVEALRDARLATKAPDIPLSNAIEQVLIDHGALSPTEQARLRWAINITIEHDYAADASTLSLYTWDQGDGFGGDEVIFPDGFGSIPDHLAKSLNIQLNQIVEHIAYTQTPTPSVTVTTNKAKFQANRCIITLPLGVLKAGKVGFSPALPRAKQDAIRRLGSGLLNKLVLKFPTAFWKEDLTQEVLGFISKPPDAWGESLNLYHHTKAPVLMLFNAATQAHAFEALPDKALVEQAMSALRAVFGASIPNPDAYKVTRWASDPFALGSYSYQAVAALPSDSQTLAEPVEDVLFFAGEATSEAFTATVHGAYMSGLREADRWHDGRLSTKTPTTHPKPMRPKRRRRRHLDSLPLESLP